MRVPAKNRSSTPGVVSFDFVEEDRRVGMRYFYVLDPEFGPLRRCGSVLSNSVVRSKAARFVQPHQGPVQENSSRFRHEAFQNSAWRDM